MNVAFSNPSRPEYGVATIPFPIPKADYDNSLFTLTALDIGNVLTADCKVEEISDDSPVFQRLVGSAVNVDELELTCNWSAPCSGTALPIPAK